MFNVYIKSDKRIYTDFKMYFKNPRKSMINLRQKFEETWQISTYQFLYRHHHPEIRKNKEEQNCYAVHATTTS